MKKEDQDDVELMNGFGMMVFTSNRMFWWKTSVLTTIYYFRVTGTGF